jgi:rubredoxin
LTTGKDFIHMALYECDVCGYVCDEAYKGKAWEELGED